MTAIRLFQPRPMAGAFFCAARLWVLACALALSFCDLGTDACGPIVAQT
ncbi:MAG: hypothetical protein RLZZ618_1912 [Pseudomonadota bacterium]|jgi:hypothetical protein